jgi:hypothetical protein
MVTILAQKVNIDDLVNNLNQSLSGYALDARQGKILKDLIDALDLAVSGKAAAVHTHGAADINESGTRVFVTPAEKTGITHANRSILDAIQEALTTSLKTAYDGAVNWISTYGANLINHLSNTANPHGVTKSQVGLQFADNTSDADKPVSSAQALINDAKQNIEAGATTGTALTFAMDRVYGSIASPETGNITANVTGAKIGVTNIVIHNHSSAPTFDSKFKKLSGSGSYTTGAVNYIFCTYINATEIVYSINQRT